MGTLTKDATHDDYNDIYEWYFTPEDFKKIDKLKQGCFYAVAKGHQTGIFNNWNDCKINTDGYKGKLFKKFNTKEEAEKFILEPPQSKIKKNVLEIENSTFEADYYVYTNSSCLNNGKKNAVAGFGIYFGENDIRNISQKVIGKQSNNTGELGAILHLYDIIENDILSGKKIGIVSDSEYAIMCATTYGKKCNDTHWIKDIPNKDMVKKVFELYNDKHNIVFLHIMSHTDKTDIHSIGNVTADKLANKAIGLDY